MLKLFKVFCFVLFILTGLTSPGQVKMDLLLSTFIGGPGNNQPIGLGMVQNKAYVAGNFNTVSLPTTNVRIVNLMGASNASKGKILVINADTRALETVINVCGTIYDFAMAPNNSSRMVLAGDSGVVLIGTQLFNLIWRTGLGDARMKVSINDEGTAAIIFSNNLMELVNTSGLIKSGLGLPYTVINDVALLGNRAFVTGYNTVINEGNFCVDSIPNNRGLQVAYMAAYDFSDTSYYPSLAYTTWGFGSEEMNCDIASTQGIKISVGQNGSLYFLGETLNSQNVFRWNGKTNWKVNGGAYPSTTFYSYDQFNSLDNTGPATLIGYAAQINPYDGTIIRGQFILTRSASLPYGASNTPYNVRDGSIAADQTGNIFIGGMAGDAIPNRNVNGLGATAPGAFSGGDPAILSTSYFQNRILWQVATGTGGSGTMMALSLSNNYLAGLVRVDKGRMITLNAFYPNPFNTSATDNSTDIVLVVWAKQSSSPTETSEAISALDNFVITSRAISYNPSNKETQEQIFNVHGVQMPLVKTSENEISLESYPTGIYLLRIASNTQTLTKKFFIF